MALDKGQRNKPMNHYNIAVHLPFTSFHLPFEDRHEEIKADDEEDANKRKKECEMKWR